VNPDTLDLVEHADAGSVVAIAAFSGRTRLIDNVVLGDDASDRFADGSTIDESRG
jgi:pantothenate synthetase